MRGQRAGKASLARWEFRCFTETKRSVGVTSEGRMLAFVSWPVITDLLEVAVSLREEAELHRRVAIVVTMPTFAYVRLPRLMCRSKESILSIVIPLEQEIPGFKNVLLE